MAAQESLGETEVEATPLYIALVDLTGGSDFLELVRSALLAALEALPPSALFALITFSDSVPLFPPLNSTHPKHRDSPARLHNTRHMHCGSHNRLRLSELVCNRGSCCLHWGAIERELRGGHGSQPRLLSSAPTSARPLSRSVCVCLFLSLSLCLSLSLFVCVRTCVCVCVCARACTLGYERVPTVSGSVSVSLWGVTRWGCTARGASWVV